MTPSVVLGALGLALLLLASLVLVLLYFPSSASPAAPPTAVLIITPGPTATVPTPTATLTLTPTATSEVTLTPLAGEIGVGGYVQIVGTQGNGLNIREGPGLSNQVKFLGYDSEVFEVGDGPRQVDGLTWWFLVTPVDAARSGWAAATYLAVIDNP